jgi:hypothetical protein
LHAIQDNNPSRVAANAMPTYNRLSAASVLTKLQLTDLALCYFLRRTC